MKCCRCNKGMNEVNGMIPIDPPGTKDRKWTCTGCATLEELGMLPESEVKLCTMINPNFIPRRNE